LSSGKIPCSRCATGSDAAPTVWQHDEADGTDALPETTRDYLKRTRYRALCGACLNHLEALLGDAAGKSFPGNAAGMIRGLHYEIEGSLWVFSEMYHMLRGHCCRSGCRNCVYGFKVSDGLDG